MSTVIPESVAARLLEVRDRRDATQQAADAVRAAYVLELSAATAEYGARAVAELLGVSRQRVDQLVRLRQDLDRFEP